MPQLKTNSHSVTGTVGIWAIPKSRWELDTEINEGTSQPFPFRFEIATNTVWTDGAIKLTDREVTWPIPDGIDLLHAALTTLKARRQEILAEAEKKCQEIEEQMQKLQLLSYSPVPVDEDGLEEETL